MRCPSCGLANIEGADLCDGCSASLAEAARPQGMERRILEGTVAALEPKPALSLRSTDSLTAAVEAMRRDKVGCMLVIDGAVLSGVISERELLRGGGDPLALSARLVSSAMRQDSLALREDDPIADAFHHMALSGHRHLPVAMKSGGYGVISARDLLHYLCR